MLVEGEVLLVRFERLGQGFIVIAELPKLFGVLVIFEIIIETNGETPKREVVVEVLR